MKKEMSDRDKVKAAFKELRKRGYVAVMREYPFNDKKAVAVSYERQKAFDENGDIKDTLYIDHEFIDQDVLEVLRSNGLTASWDGDRNQAIAVKAGEVQ